MPYIRKGLRGVFDHQIDALINVINQPGELTYVVYRLMRGFIGTEKNYFRLATCVGAMFLCIMEFTRRVVFPYEDKKIHDNGEVE